MPAVAVWSNRHERRNAEPGTVNDLGGHAPRAADTVVVRTTARLHLGFLNPGSGNGRQFGSIGLSLDAPHTEVTLQRGVVADDVGGDDTDHVVGDDAARAAGYLDTIRARLGLACAHRLRVRAAVPPHAGLGSGTQLALAVGAAVRMLHGMAPDPRADAAWLGRGARSGIGVGLFTEGGVVVDGGRGAADAPPPLLARMAMPADWRVILVLDRRQAGLSGREERAAFAALPPFPQAATDRLCRLVLMQVLPALAESDLRAFGDGVATLQAEVGEHFARHQGGRFSSARVAAACAALSAAGAVGVGQSSWGPTGFAFAHVNEATQIVASALATGAAEGLDVQVRCARNRGAVVERTAAAPSGPEENDDGR